MSKNQTLEDLLADDSFIRYIRGTASGSEKNIWEEWAARDTLNRDLVRQARELMFFTSASQVHVPDPREELIHFEKFLQPSPPPLKQRRRKINLKQAPRRRRNYGWAAAAATVLILFSLSIFLDDSMYQDEGEQEIASVQTSSEFQTSHGEKASLQLSDGSRIILNANSHLRYSYVGTAAGTRDIDIHLKGEAWFDIRPVNADGENNRAIRIHTRNGLVEVLGTTFAVRASDDATRAVLEKGTIRIARLGNVDMDSGDLKEIIMYPGEMATLPAGNSNIELSSVNPDIYTSWIRDVWIFDQTPLTEVAERIRTVFGVDVSIASSELREKKLSGSIGSENLQIIRQGISEALDEPVFQQNGTVIIGRQYSP